MTASAPKIAVICGQDIDPIPEKPRIHETSERYTSAVIDQGGLPFLIPVDFPLSSLDLLFDLFEGMLLIGGDDVAISRFGGLAQESVSAPNETRDEIEIQAVQQAAARDFPLLGICRGAQVINVAMGGGLITDIASQRERAEQHQNKAEPGKPEILQTVEIIPGSKVHDIYQCDRLEVNSYHHQAADNLAPGFRPAAFASDGIIEAIESETHRFIIGIQWHPERMQHDPLQRKIFRSFVDSCRQK